MKLSEILAREGIKDDEVSDDLDIKGILRELKEIMKLSDEMQRRQEGLNNSVVNAKVIRHQDIPQEIKQDIPKPEIISQAVNEQIPLKTIQINRQKLKENLKEILKQYKDNDTISSFTIKDGLEFLFLNDQYLDIAVNIIIDMVEKSKE
jgi:hypothetical protein